jgi:hypothetical protein
MKTIEKFESIYHDFFCNISIDAGKTIIQDTS